MRILAGFIGCICLLLCISCSPNYYARKGDQLFDKGRYYRAQSYFDKAYNKSDENGFKSEVAFKAGLSFETINEPKKAIKWFKRAVMKRDSFSEALVHLTQVRIKTGDIEDAEKAFSDYQNCVPEEARGNEERLVEVFQRITDWQDSPQAYIVLPMDKFNTRASEFTPMYLNGDPNIVVFSSTRKGEHGRMSDGVTGDLYSNLYRSDYTNEVVRNVKNKRGRVVRSKRIVKDDFEWQKPVSLGDSVNSISNEGAACLNPEGNLLYITSTRKIDGQDRGSKIYAIPVNGDGWGEIRKVEIVPDSLSVGHPSISADGETMYFASDMAGGFGGKDIWMVKSEGGIWGSPVNLGEDINTENNEHYPFIRDNGSLYFASDRYEGMGGLDIYEAKPAFGAWDVRNMQYPINSTADDFSIVFQAGKRKGMFASSRNKGNDDIFSFEKNEIDSTLILMAEGKVSFDEGLGGKYIRVRVVSDKGDRSIVSLGKHGDFKVAIHADTEYTITVSGQDFLSEEKVIKAGDINVNLKIDLDFELKGIGVPIRLKNVLFGFNEWLLSDEAKIALNDLVTTIETHSDISIELSSHTDFVGEEQVNDSISKLRAEVCVDYLVDQGVDRNRLKALSYGENKPWVVKQVGQDNYPFLKVGDVMSKEFIDKLTSEEEKQVVMQLNRRTEILIRKIEK